MKIAVLGAGFTGLAGAYYLSKNGYKITVFEKDSNPGGLAVGYKEKEWVCSLEKHYHHWFTNDNFILNLARDINHGVIIKTPETNWYVNNRIYKFVSLQAALTFPLLTPFERVRHLAVLAALRFNPFWKPLEKLSAHQVLSKLMGEKTYRMLWESLLRNKFGEYADDISLAWFWARIKKRTQSLAYPEGGFLNFANHLVEEIKKHGGEILFDTEVLKILSQDGKLNIKTKEVNSKMKSYQFDRVIVTLPSFIFTRIAPQLPGEYVDKLKKLKGLGAINVILRLKEPFFKDNTYWLSIADATSPVMAIVEHTNFIDKKYYNNEHIVYVGNYLPHDHPYMKLSKEELLKIYNPFLQKIHPNYQLSTINYQLFTAPFAQPIIGINYSKILPPLITPLKNVYLANIQQVYPWDRGTNYAVELGEKVAKLMLEEKS